MNFAPESDAASIPAAALDRSDSVASLPPAPLVAASRYVARIFPAFLFLGLLMGCMTPMAAADKLADGFAAPPDSARPWVYWYFMDGNLTREGMTADLKAMKQAGIGGAIFLKVNIGIPRGLVEFMSPAWRELLVHAVREADRPPDPNPGKSSFLAVTPSWLDPLKI